jgi:hypothetical protein
MLIEPNVSGNGITAGHIFQPTKNKPDFDYNNSRFGYICFFISAELCRNKK